MKKTVIMKGMKKLLANASAAKGLKLGGYAIGIYTTKK
jgi:hypothetical protein